VFRAGVDQVLQHRGPEVRRREAGAPPRNGNRLTSRFLGGARRVLGHHAHGATPLESSPGFTIFALRWPGHGSRRPASSRFPNCADLVTKRPDSFVLAWFLGTPPRRSRGGSSQNSDMKVSPRSECCATGSWSRRTAGAAPRRLARRRSPRFVLRQRSGVAPAAPHVNAARQAFSCVDPKERSD